MNCVVYCMEETVVVSCLYLSSLGVCEAVVTDLLFHIMVTTDHNRTLLNLIVIPIMET